MNITDIWKAMQLGKEIKDPATWKSRQNATNAIAGILAILYSFLPAVGVNVSVSPADQISIAGGFAALLTVVNMVLTTITTKKVGLPVSAEKALK